MTQSVKRRSSCYHNVGHQSHCPSPSLQCRTATIISPAITPRIQEQGLVMPLRVEPRRPDRFRLVRKRKGDLVRREDRLANSGSREHSAIDDLHTSDAAEEL